MPMSRLVWKTNFRDVNETKIGRQAGARSAMIFLAAAAMRGEGDHFEWERAGVWREIVEWLHLQQVQSVSVERATLRLPASSLARLLPSAS